MKVDRKKDFKKKFNLFSTLLEVEEPIKIILDESFLSCCINFKIPIKDELTKLANRKLRIMTTNCIATKSKQINQETSYGLKKMLRYNCCHDKEKELNSSVNNFLKQKYNTNFNHKNNFFENGLTTIHNFDNLYNFQDILSNPNKTKENTKKEEREKGRTKNEEKEKEKEKEKQVNSDSKEKRKEEEKEKKKSQVKKKPDSSTFDRVKCEAIKDNDSEIEKEEKKKKQEKKNTCKENNSEEEVITKKKDSKEKDILENIEETNEKETEKIKKKKESQGKDDETKDEIPLSASAKCIIDLVKNNNEKKIFIGTNNLQLRSVLRKIFLVPIIYINECGIFKMEHMSTRNENKKVVIEKRKMKIPQWERDLRMLQRKKDNEYLKQNSSFKKKKNKKNLSNNIKKTQKNINKKN